MGSSNTKLEEDLWSGSTNRYKSASSPSESKTPSSRSRVETPRGNERVEDHGANLDPDEGLRETDPYDPETAGPIFPNGEINWDCPCLGGAAHGPCGTEFREAFSCFHYRLVKTEEQLK